MRILMTNDDSSDSPLLHMTIKHLKSWASELVVVMPAQEQSWTGKCITRFQDVRAEETQIEGVRAVQMWGRPADCVNAGVHSVMGGAVDLVVSGINIGYNCGVSYVVSSGTVGAALEANIAGVPGLALSRWIGAPEYQRWVRERSFDGAFLERCEAETVQVLAELRRKLFSRAELWQDRVTWAVEMPQRLRAEWKLRPAVLGHSFYGRLFEPVEGGGAYRHQLKPFDHDGRENADFRIIERGDVAVSRIDLRVLGQLPPVF